MMQYQATINKITQYEVAMLDENITTVDISKYMGKIHTLREQLFYSLADKAYKREEFRVVLIDDAVRFVVFEERFITQEISAPQFSSALNEILETYQNLQEFDKKDVLLKAILSHLQKVIPNLRERHKERINDVYAVLKNVLELKQKEL